MRGPNRNESKAAIQKELDLMREKYVIEDYVEKVVMRCCEGYGSCEISETYAVTS